MFLLDKSAEIDMTSYETVNSLLQEKFKFSKRIAEIAYDTFGEQWKADFEETVSTLMPERDDLEAALRGYSGFALDFMRRQRKFETEREYEHSSYSQAFEEVYNNEEYMMGQYLPGLLLSHYFWNHHYSQLQFFEQFYLSQFAKSQHLSFCEIGIGTGLYSRRVLQILPGSNGTGYDISSSSERYTAEQMSKFDLQDRYKINLQDILTMEEVEQYACLICVEVLEHLEVPLAFLKKLREFLRPGSNAFITAALNSPDKDHIYLYRSPDEVLSQLEEAGFSLVQSFHAAAFRPTKPGSPYPSVAAFIVS